MSDTIYVINSRDDEYFRLTSHMLEEANEIAEELCMLIDANAYYVTLEKI